MTASIATFGVPSLTGTVVFIGDSQFTKQLGTALEVDLDIPTVVGDCLNAPGITIHNQAVGGQTSVGAVQSIANTLPLFDATQPVSCAVIMIGGNDFHYNVLGAGPVYENWTDIVHQCRQHGAKQVVGCTTTPRAPTNELPDFDASRTVLNAALKDAPFLDAFVDMRADPIMGAPGTNYNGRYFWQSVPNTTPVAYDRVHYTHDGALYYGSRIAAALLALFAPLEPAAP